MKFSKFPIHFFAFIIINLWPQLSMAAETLPFSKMLDRFKSILGVSEETGTVNVGDKCELKYEFKQGNDLMLKVLNKSNFKELSYYVSISDTIKAVEDGFEVVQVVGLDCETQGCISYQDARLQITSQSFIIEDRSEYDPIHYATIVSLTCK